MTIIVERKGAVIYRAHSMSNQNYQKHERRVLLVVLSWVLNSERGGKKEKKKKKKIAHGERERERGMWNTPPLIVIIIDLKK